MLRATARAGGFSIVEILITLAIIAMVIGLAAPSAMVWIQNTQLRNAADAVLGGVQQARLEALKRNTTVAFELQDPNSTQFHVCLYDVVTGACQAATPDLASRSASEGSPNAKVGVETVFTAFTVVLGPGVNVPSLVAFDSFGRVSPQSPTNIARIDVRNTVLAAADERRMSIFIAPGGQIRMCDPQLAQATNPQGCQ
jgi:type IV fimbrial biogenesis protein FimT